MRNPNNAVSDTIAHLQMGEAVRTLIDIDPQNVRRWLIRFESRNNALIRSFMDVEVIEENDGDATVCVLRRFNVGRRAMIRIMNTLVDKLEDPPRLEGPWEQRPEGGEPRDPQQ
jgi:hypothetical protein